MTSERFHKAARDGIISVLKETTKRDCNAKDEDGMTPTLWAAFEGRLEALRLLVARGGDPDKGDHFGNNALHYAAERGHMECVTFLANFGANLWALNCDMHTPKELAAINNRYDILRFLDEMTAKLEATNRKEVKLKKDKAQKELERKLKDYEKVKKKVEKNAEQELTKIKRDREKIDCDGSRRNSVLMTLRNKVSGIAGVDSIRNKAQSPRFSEIVGTVRSENGRSLLSGSVLQRKIQAKKFATHRGEPDDFKVVEVEDGKKSIRPLTGLKRDSEILYVGNYDGQCPNRRGRLCDIFDSKKDDCEENEIQEPGSIFDRPGFGSFAFRKSISSTFNALTLSENEKTDESQDGSSIGSAGSLMRRQEASDIIPWPLEEEDDEDSLEAEDWSPLQLFLVANGLGEYLGKFQSEKIDLEALELLTDEDLISLGLPLGPRRKLTTAIRNRKQTLSDPPSELQDSPL